MLVNNNKNKNNNNNNNNHDTISSIISNERNVTVILFKYAREIRSRQRIFLSDFFETVDYIFLCDRNWVIV